jgi:hypothetical protein
VTPRKLTGALLLLGLATAGCKKSSERIYRDTEQREIKATCDRENRCTFSLKSGDRPGPEKTDVAIWSPGRLVAVCDVTAGKAPETPSDCRPIVCTDDSGCPSTHGLAQGTCINGLCIEPENELGVEDAVMLCLAGTGLGTTKPDRLALALNCGSPCKVPAVCRQP